LIKPLGPGDCMIKIGFNTPKSNNSSHNTTNDYSTFSANSSNMQFPG